MILEVASTQALDPSMIIEGEVGVLPTSDPLFKHLILLTPYFNQKGFLSSSVPNR